MSTLKDKLRVKKDLVVSDKVDEDILADTHALPLKLDESSQPQNAPSNPVGGLGDLFKGLGEGDSAVAGIRELINPKGGGKDANDLALLSVIGNIKNPDLLTRLLFHADYVESIGLGRRAYLLRRLGFWKILNDMAKSGDDNRAKLVLDSYKKEIQAQFEIDKRKKESSVP